MITYRTPIDIMRDIYHVGCPAELLCLPMTSETPPPLQRCRSCYYVITRETSTHDTLLRRSCSIIMAVLVPERNTTTGTTTIC